MFTMSCKQGHNLYTQKRSPCVDVVAAKAQAHPYDEEYDGGAAPVEAQATILSCNRIAEEGLKIWDPQCVLVNHGQASTDVWSQ